MGLHLRMKSRPRRYYPLTRRVVLKLDELQQSTQLISNRGSEPQRANHARVWSKRKGRNTFQVPNGRSSHKAKIPTRADSDLFQQAKTALNAPVPPL